jgi:hypothetical protein
MMKALITILRPHDDRTKNALCSAGSLFGGRLLDPDAILKCLCVFGVFCMASQAA